MRSLLRLGLVLIVLNVGVIGAWYLGRHDLRSNLPSPKPTVKPVPLPNMDDELAVPTAAWLERYGMCNETRLYYNVVMQRAVLNQHARVINEIRTTMGRATTQPVEKP